MYNLNLQPKLLNFIRKIYFVGSMMTLTLTTMLIIEEIYFQLRMLHKKSVWSNERQNITYFIS